MLSVLAAINVDGLAGLGAAAAHAKPHLSTSGLNGRAIPHLISDGEEIGFQAPPFSKRLSLNNEFLKPFLRLH